MALIVDTGPLYASLDGDDADHARSAELLLSPPGRERLVVPAPVLVETCYFVEEHLGQKAVAAFLKDVASGAFHVECLTADDYERAAELVQTYADSRLGFVDAAVAAVVERLRETKLASLDHRHFSMIRFAHGIQVELLPAAGSRAGAVRPSRKR